MLEKFLSHPVVKFLSNPWTLCALFAVSAGLGAASGAGALVVALDAVTAVLWLVIALLNTKRAKN